MATGEFEGLRDADDFADPFEKFEITVIEIAMDADGAKDGVGCAGGAMNVEAAGDNAIDDALDLLVGGVFLHYDDHDLDLEYWDLPGQNGNWKKQRFLTPQTPFGMTGFSLGFDIRQNSEKPA
jgi:hypothetical protein